jgi:alpha-ketoglutaric semialdehyde dehydrogenase
MATMEQKAPAAVASKATVYKNFINGEWVESHSGRTFENLNPADTRDVVGVFQRSDAEDVNRAIDAASEAYKKWRLVPAPRRAEMLYKASEILIGRKEEYAQLMTREMGKVIKETRGDVQEAGCTGSTLRH